jgi:hypothetical protein
MRFGHFSIIVGVLVMCVAVSPMATGETINIGRTFQGFSAADLDTTPTFAGEIQGINLGNTVQFGPLTADETIGGVTLLRQDNAAAAGIVVNPDPSGIAGQALPSLGATADDDALERVFNFGEFNNYDVTFPVDSVGTYKLQVLMFEFISIFRTFDIDIDGASGADELSVIQNDGLHQDAVSGVSTTSYTVYEAIVPASGSTMTISLNAGESLGQPHPLAAQDPEDFAGATINDVSPFAHGIILERVPEPSTAMMVLIGMGAWIARRRSC